MSICAGGGRNKKKKRRGHPAQLELSEEDGMMGQQAPVGSE